MKRTMIVVALVPVAFSVVWQLNTLAQQASVETRPPNGAGQTPAFAGQTRAPEQKSNVAFDVVTVVGDLQGPWGLTFLPGSRLLVTERPGRLRIVAADGKLSEPVAGLPAVDARGQGGLLDVSLDPGFATNQLIYWSFSEPREGGANNTAVARGKLVEGTAPRARERSGDLSSGAVAQFHGTFRQQARLESGRNAVCDAGRPLHHRRAHAGSKMDSLLGKVVRINADGSIPKDNPFVGKEGVRPEIWSIGHRNVQGATLHPTTGELWTIEHGTRGGDELNIPRKGQDYGWPTIAYGIEYRGGPITGGIQAKEGMEQPRYYWDPVIAPGGMTFYNGALFPAWQGNLFIGSLGGTHLVRLTLNGERVIGEERLLTDLQPRSRIRNVRQGPDGALYVLAEGNPGRILKLVPKRP